MTCDKCGCDVEALWELVDHFAISDARAFEWYGENVRSILPPRQPKLVTGLTLQEALEGLRDGVYARAQPEGLPEATAWVELRGSKMRWNSSGSGSLMFLQCLGTWRAEAV